MAQPRLKSKRILVIPLRYIGDTILTVPLIRNLRENFPDARLDVMASPVTQSLLEPCPYLDDVFVEPEGLFDCWQKIQSARYDTVFLLRKSVSMALTCKFAGVKYLVGYDKQRFPFGYKRWGWFLDIAARYPGLKTDTPQALSHFRLLTASGLTIGDEALELWSTQHDTQMIDALLENHEVTAEKPLAVFHVASASHGKQVEPEKFVESLLSLKQQGYTIVTTGTAPDAAVYEGLKKMYELPLVNLAGKTSLRETVTLYRRAQMVLSVDSAPLHIAAAVGVPQIVSVFGPTNERQWGVYNKVSQFYPVFMDLPCRPCYAKVCSHNNCRTMLTQAQIAEAVNRAIPTQR